MKFSHLSAFYAAVAATLTGTSYAAEDSLNGDSTPLDASDISCLRNYDSWFECASNHCPNFEGDEQDSCISSLELDEAGSDDPFGCNEATQLCYDTQSVCCTDSTCNEHLGNVMSTCVVPDDQECSNTIDCNSPPPDDVPPTATQVESVGVESSITKHGCARYLIDLTYCMTFFCPGECPLINNNEPETCDELQTACRNWSACCFDGACALQMEEALIDCTQCVIDDCSPSSNVEATAGSTTSSSTRSNAMVGLATAGAMIIMLLSL